MVKRLLLQLLSQDSCGAVMGVAPWCISTASSLSPVPSSVLPGKIHLMAPD